jgi:hypothetical protein
MNAISSVFAYQLGPALASATMSIMLWLPLWIGIVLLLLAIPVISALPLGLGATNHEGTEDDEYQRVPLLSSPQLKAQDRKRKIITSIKTRIRTIGVILTSHPRNFGLLLTCFFLTSLASSDTKLFTQYISKRYHWTFASVGYLMSAKAVFNFFYQTLVVPAILRFRSQRRSVRRDDDTTHAAATLTDKDNLLYAKICFVPSALGALAIASASSIPALVPALLLYALGIALPIFTYSLLKSEAISPRDTTTEGRESPSRAGQETQIFSIVMLVKTVGLLVGAPLMATLWVKGIGMGGAWLGLPFFASAAVYAMAAGVFSHIRI